MTKRGEPLPINQALNRPRAKLGLDLSAWMAIVFVCVTVFLVGLRVVALIAFPFQCDGSFGAIADGKHQNRSDGALSVRPVSRPTLSNL
jgi:hypothetical protein